MRRSIMAALVAASALSACVAIAPPVVQKGRFSNHREMAYSMSQNLSWPGVPTELQREMRTCMVDAAYSVYTPDEVARLDRYARGEQHLTADEFRRIDRAVAERVGGEQAVKALLERTCPEVMQKAAAFKAGMSMATATKPQDAPAAVASNATASPERIYCWDPSKKIAYTLVGSACVGADIKTSKQHYDAETAEQSAAAPVPPPSASMQTGASSQASPSQTPVPDTNATTLQAALEAPRTLDVSKLTFKWSGTAFFVSPAGHLLTNEHVVGQCPVPAVATDTGIFRVKVIASDARNDLALAELPSKRKTYAAFSNRLPAPGDDAYAIGYPLFTEYWDIKVTEGIISGLSGPDGDRRLVQISAPVQPGNSGGPLVNSAGLVVGVVEGKRGGLVAENVVAEGIGFAVAPVIAAAFLKENGVEPAVSNATKKREARDIVADVQKWTVPFLCFEK